MFKLPSAAISTKKATFTLKEICSVTWGNVGVTTIPWNKDISPRLAQRKEHEAQASFDVTALHGKE